MDLIIEKATKKEAPCVAKIENECFSTPFKEKDIIAYLDDPIWHFLVAKIDDEVVCYISFTIILDECQIVNVATTPSYRKMGIGARLIEEFLEYIRTKGCKTAYLEVRESNLPAIRLYEKFGFVAVGISKNHYSKPTENALLMKLEL